MAKKRTKKTITKNATTMTDKEGVQYHIKLKKGDVPDVVILPGDPKRVLKIAKQWDTNKKIAEYRQFVTYSGQYKGKPVAALSSGIGPSACEIAITELNNIGVNNIIRVGSCGTLREDIELGELIISEAAVRLEDTSGHYVMKEYPAVASRMITSALIRACEENNLPYHVGITASSSSFYVGQGREYMQYLPSHRSHLVEDLTKANVLNFEMEASLMFVLGSIFDLNVGAVCAVYANRTRNEFAVKGEDLAIKAANEATKILYDELEKKKKYWY